MVRQRDKKTALCCIFILLPIAIMASSCTGKADNINVQDIATGIEEENQEKDKDIDTNTGETIPNTSTPDTVSENEIIKLRQQFIDKLGDTEAVWYENVPQDTTSMFRMLVTYSDVEIDKDLAIEYTNAYISSDNQIHFIVNPSLRTTTRINKLGNLIFVTQHEYIDEEENDLNLLSDGEVVKEFILNLETGECLVDE